MLLSLVRSMRVEGLQPKMSCLGRRSSTNEVPPLLPPPVRPSQGRTQPIGIPMAFSSKSRSPYVSPKAKPGGVKSLEALNLDPGVPKVSPQIQRDFLNFKGNRAVLESQLYEPQPIPLLGYSSSLKGSHIPCCHQFYLRFSNCK